MKFEQPIDYELVCSFDFFDLNPRKASDREILYLLCKGGLSHAAMEIFHERGKAVNRFVIAGIVLTDSVVSAIRRELRKVSPGLRVSTDEVEEILKKGVFKREVVEGDQAENARSRLKKALKKTAKKKKKALQKLSPTPVATTNESQLGDKESK